MTPLGWLHLGAATLALAAGARVIASRKGSRPHVLFGRTYGIAMLLVNVPALLMYEESGAIGPFHALAIVSLATLTFGLAPLLLGYRSRRNVARHGIFMSWSYVGLVAAGLAQLADSVYGGRAVLFVSLGVIAVGAVIIHLVGPRIEQASVAATRLQAGFERGIR